MSENLSSIWEQNTLKIKQISFFIFFILSMSSVSMAFADQKTVDSIFLDQNKLLIHDQNFHKQIISQNKLVQVNLSENLGVKSNDDKSETSQENHVVIETYHVHNIIALSESLGITTNSFDQHLNSLVKQNSERLTTAERISNLDRVRSSGKYSQNNELVNNPLNSFDTISFAKYFNDRIVGLDYTLYVNPMLSKFSLDMSNDVSTLFMVINLPTHEIQNLYDKSSVESNTVLLILLIPFSGYLLIRSENLKLKISNKKRILSFCFMIILISSAAVTPISVSPAFLQIVYAETMNDTQTNSSQPDVTPTTNGSHISFQFSNATNFHPSNQSNATILPSFQFSNATNFHPSNQSNATILPSFQFSNATNFHPSNQSSSSTIILPIPTESWNFTASDLKSMAVGKARIDNSTNTTSLSLTGNGYLKQNSTSTQNLSALTLSVWIKPDYSQGSPQFTVISKENTFILAVNNNIQPSKKAIFSVFDGIKWNTVVSNSTIPENWTHLVATYDGSSIGIYVNGTQESKIPLVGVSTISIHGKIENQTVGTLSSNSDVVIGAYMNSVRNNANNLFSGSIRDVKLYDSLLAPYQITGLYLGNNKQFASMIQNATLAVLPTNSTIPAQANSSHLSETLSMTDVIQALINSASLTNINGTNSTGINDTSSLLVVPTITNLKSSYMMSESPEFEFKIFNDSDIKKIKKTVIQSMQQGKWSEKNTTISIKVIAPDGTEIPIKSQFKKMKEGQFDIKLISGRYGKPGMYTIKMTLTKNGKTYDTQSQYAWGLVSLNTEKSIYKPGDTANLIIAVLANNGSSVCDANIVMKITDPNLHDTILTTPNNITSGECGLYNAQYVTSSEGNYTVDVTAKSYSGISHFSTYFMVEKNFAYDITRTADTKIDPFDNPNIFSVKINVKSLVGSGPVTIREYVPNVLNVTTDGTISQSGDTKIITWKRNLDANNSTYVTYTYSVPLIQPELYTLGKVEVDQNNQPTFNEARNWYVAVDATKTYTLNTVNIAADWTGNTFTWTQGSTTCTSANTTDTGPMANVLAKPTSSSISPKFCYHWFSPLVVSTSKQYVFSAITTHTSDFSAVNTAIPSGTVSVSTNSAMSATYDIVYTQSFSESLGLSDTVSNTKSLKTTLTDSLGLSDTVSNTKSLHTTLTESLGLSDTMATT
ncbi:MAG: LamG domain-containing protein, partial [Nitrosotalea sp.]